MQRAILAGFFPLFFFSVTLAQESTDRLKHSVYLIGNTGKDTLPSEAIQLLAFECFDDTASTVILLGDNVLPSGIRSKEGRPHPEDLRKLSAQFELFAPYRGGFYLVPGDRDWSFGTRKGQQRLEQEKGFADSWFREQSIVGNRKESVFPLAPGNPGPVVIQPVEGLKIVLLDSEWFFLRGKLARLSGLSKSAARKSVLQKLTEVLDEAAARNEKVVVALHHPFFSNGKRAHYRQPLRFLINSTPLFFLGYFGLHNYLSQDLSQPVYKRYRKRLLDVFSGRKNLIVASAHEQAMEYFFSDSVHYVVSGAGSAVNLIDRYYFPARFMDDLQTGFFKINVMESGKTTLHAYGVKDRGEYWSMVLFQGDKLFAPSK